MAQKDKKAGKDKDRAARRAQRQAKRDERNRESQRQAAAWLQGRNGSDELAVATVGLGLILLLIDVFVHQAWLVVLALVAVAYGWFRLSSKDVAKRRDENEHFLSLIGPLAPWLRDPQKAAREKKDYKHGVCPHCGQKVRVPRGKGRLRVTCPKCHTKFEIKS